MSICEEQHLWPNRPAWIVLWAIPGDLVMRTSGSSGNRQTWAWKACEKGGRMKCKPLAVNDASSCKTSEWMDSTLVAYQDQHKGAAELDRQVHPSGFEQRAKSNAAADSCTLASA